MTTIRGARRTRHPELSPDEPGETAAQLGRCVAVARVSQKNEGDVVFSRELGAVRGEQDIPALAKAEVEDGEEVEAPPAPDGEGALVSVEARDAERARDDVEAMPFDP